MVFAHSQTTNKLVNEAANDSARVSRQESKKKKTVSEPIRLQDLEDSARSHAWKKINKLIIIHNKYMYTFSYKKYLLGEPILDKQ